MPRAQFVCEMRRYCPRLSEIPASQNQPFAAPLASAVRVAAAEVQEEVCLFRQAAAAGPAVRRDGPAGEDSQGTEPCRSACSIIRLLTHRPHLAGSVWRPWRHSARAALGCGPGGVPAAAVEPAQPGRVARGGDEGGAREHAQVHRERLRHNRPDEGEDPPSAAPCGRARYGRQDDAR